MNDLVVAIGLVLVIEGLVWGVAPEVGIKLLEATSRTPHSTLRMLGFGAVAVGVFFVWLVRG